MKMERGIGGIASVNFITGVQTTVMKFREAPDGVVMVKLFFLSNISKPKPPKPKPYQNQNSKPVFVLVHV
jgi:hypothetical protein